MKKIICLFGIILFLGTSYCFAQETISITTYYPSPYGVYDSLSMDKLGVGDNDGDGGLDSDDVPTNSGEVWIDGNVNIGTTSSTFRVNLVGDGVSNATMFVHDETNSNAIRIRPYGIYNHYPNDLLQFGASTDMVFETYPVDSWVERMRLTQGGYLGIGITTPDEKLHLYNAGNVNLKIDSAAASRDAQIIFSRGTGNDTWFGPTVGNTFDLWITESIPILIGVNDDEKVRITPDGNVGIGITNPTVELDVVGDANVSNTLTVDSLIATTKVTSAVWDPIYEINGKKYATYGPDFAGGVRIETSGLVNLQLMDAESLLEPLSKVKPAEYGYVIDFANLQQDSDLWLFWQASNKNLDAISILLTPNFAGKVWYKKQENKLTIYGEQEGEISYWLSALRVDHQEWGNLAEDQTLEGIIVDKYQ